jgi:hypothetical protein
MFADEISIAIKQQNKKNRFSHEETHFTCIQKILVLATAGVQVIQI